LSWYLKDGRERWRFPGLQKAKIIFFREQKLSIEQHMAFGRRFGKLHINPGSPDVDADHPEALVIKVDDNAQVHSRRGLAFRRVVRS
jgi:alpha-ketoglutarate-dependent taurine dioxygenase